MGTPSQELETQLKTLRPELEKLQELQQRIIKQLRLPALETTLLFHPDDLFPILNSFNIQSDAINELTEKWNTFIRENNFDFSKYRSDEKYLKEKRRISFKLLGDLIKKFGITGLLIEHPRIVWNHLQEYFEILQFYFLEQYNRLPEHTKADINNLFTKSVFVAMLFTVLYGGYKFSRYGLKKFYNKRKAYVEQNYPLRIPIINELEVTYKKTPVGFKKFQLLLKLFRVLFKKGSKEKDNHNHPLRRPSLKHKEKKTKSTPKILKRRKRHRLE